jgi:transposase-like protein
MTKQSQAFKAQIVEKLLSPDAQSVEYVSRETGIGKSTLCRWKSDYQGTTDKVSAKSGAGDPENWAGQKKLAVVIETAGLNEHERSAYCREKGLHVEQITRWLAQAAEGCQGSGGNSSESQKQTIRALKQQARTAEKEIRRKEKALAKAAALLVLKKKPRYFGHGYLHNF